MNEKNLGHPMMVVLRDKSKRFTLAARHYIKQRIISAVVILTLIAFLLAYTRLNMIAIPVAVFMVLSACLHTFNAFRTINFTRVSEIEDMVYGDDYSAMELNYEKVTRLTTRVDQGFGELAVHEDTILYEYVINIITVIVTCALFYISHM